MTFRLIAAVALGAAASALVATASHAAEIKLMSSGAVQAAILELIPQFERASGHKVTTDFDLPPSLIRKVESGTPFDAIILSLDVEPLIKQGKVAADSRTVLGRTGVGMAIPQGAPKPDVSTVEAFKRSLLDAKAITTSGDGSSGRYVLTLLDRLGIADQIKPKIKSGPTGAAAQFLAKREVDFAVIGRPPVAGVAGVEWAGPVPDELQSWVLFTGGVGAAAKEPAAARALLNFLTTPPAVAVFQAKGVDPAP